jgi:excisionase family DNA binding protein
MSDTLKRYLSVKQVTERLNNAISVKLVYKLIAQGKLRANRATGKVLVEEESLVELMGEKPRATRPPPVKSNPRRSPAKPEVRLW